ncbi:hypothetical protein PHLCEN_2v2663, partial [Hermanssonia centrifuga]
VEIDSQPAGFTYVGGTGYSKTETHTDRLPLFKTQVNLRDQILLSPVVPATSVSQHLIR